MAWTEDRVETLKQLWTDGLSASQIARKMGGVTRNAVIGKVHRLGLSGRATPARVSTARVNTSTARMRPAAPSLASGRSRFRDASLDDLKEEVIPQPILSPEERASVLHLTEHTCKWPIGDPGTTEFHFCGALAKSGSPYCTTHAAQAYQPLERRRRRAGTN
ncbi:GcrA cell cycle regulator [Alphaproteobacteria bacterium]|nr:GcrA cell cycle regulator [Alphaproteobacteria bacterium]